MSACPGTTSQRSCCRLNALVCHDISVSFSQVIIGALPRHQPFHVNHRPERAQVPQAQELVFAVQPHTNGGWAHNPVEDGAVDMAVKMNIRREQRKEASTRSGATTPTGRQKGRKTKSPFFVVLKTHHLNTWILHRTCLKHSNFIKKNCVHNRSHMEHNSKGTGNRRKKQIRQNELRQGSKLQLHC